MVDFENSEQVKQYTEGLTAKLSAESMVQAIKDAGCFLVAYELLKPQVVDAVKDFFTVGVRDGKEVYSAKWSKLLNEQSKPGDRAATREWNAAFWFLLDSRALTQEQVGDVMQIRSHRNEIAHELPRMLIYPEFEIRTELIIKAQSCMRSLTRFWASIEVDINPAFDDIDIDLDQMQSGASAMMDYVIEVTRETASRSMHEQQDVRSSTE